MGSGAEREQDFQLVQETVQALEGLLREDAIVQVVLRQIVAAVPARGAILRLLGPDGDRLFLKGAVGLSQAFLEKGAVSASQRAIDQRVLAGQLEVSDDCTAEPDYPYAEQARAEGLSGAVIVPLSLRKRAIGLVRVFLDAPRELPAERLRLVALLADIGALVLEKARLHDSLYRLSETLHGSLELEPMLGEVLRTTMEDMGFSAASIRLLTEDGETLKLMAAAGVSEAYQAAPPVRLVDSAVDGRALGGETVALHDLGAEAGWPCRDLIVSEGFVAALLVPLTIGERRLGVLRAYSARQRPLGPVAQSYLVSVARLVALAIEKASLHQALRAQYDNLKLDLDEWYSFLALG